MGIGTVGKCMFGIGILFIIILFSIAYYIESLDRENVEVPCVDAAGNEIVNSVCIDEVFVDADTAELFGGLFPFCMLISAIGLFGGFGFLVVSAFEGDD